MTSSKPYLIRALYEWICDNAMTPHLVVEANAEGVSVPPEAVQDDRVVLNIAPRAVSGLSLGDDQIDFRARFGGKGMSVRVPVAAVLAVYARENGQGMMFPADEGAPPPVGPDDDTDGRPHLRVVK